VTALEDRDVTISRARFTVTYPASFMLVASMNPSPGGNFNDPRAPVASSPQEMQRYLSKVSGLLLADSNSLNPKPLARLLLLVLRRTVTFYFLNS